MTAVAEPLVEIEEERVLRPLDDVIWILRDPIERKHGILWLPDQAQRKQERGTVIATGPGKRLKNGKRRPLDVQVGDRVLFSRYLVERWYKDGTQYLITREKELLGRIVED